MRTRAIRIHDVDIETWEDGHSGDKTGLLHRFRHFIENSEWDEALLRNGRWLQGVSWIVVLVGVLFILSSGIRLIF